MHINKSVAEKRLVDLFMDDLPIIEWSPVPFSAVNDWFSKYKRLRIEFMKTLSDSIEDLSFLNLSQDEFMGLIMGRKMPANMSLRLRIPLFYGGKLEIDNMFLCKTFPTSHNMDRFILEQMGTKTVWLPNPAKKIYISAHMASGGDGGNTTDDRVSQMASMMSASMGMG